MFRFNVNTPCAIRCCATPEGTEHIVTYVNHIQGQHHACQIICICWVKFSKTSMTNFKTMHMCPLIYILQNKYMRIRGSFKGCSLLPYNGMHIFLFNFELNQVLCGTQCCCKLINLYLFFNTNHMWDTCIPFTFLTNISWMCFPIKS